MNLISYIDKEYFDDLDSITPSIFKNKDDETNAENIKLTIRAGLMASYIKTNLSNKDCIKYYKRVQDNTVISTSWKEEIIYRAIIDKNFEQVSEIKQDEANAVYFLRENGFANSNKIVISEFHNKHNYYDNLNQRYDIDDNLKNISVIKHEANSIVIADPYIFNDTPGRPEKLPNIIKFLQQIFTIPNRTYYLSFIGQNRNDNLNLIVESRFKDIQLAFPQNEIKISGLFTKEDIFGKNRYIFTNYCLCGYQHLFDRDAEIFPTCLFIHATGNIKNRIDKIKENYASISLKLNKIKAIFKNEPERFGLIKIKFGNILHNPLFD